MSNEITSFYLRAGLSVGDPSEARFDWNGMDVVMFVEEDGSVRVHKVLKDGSPGAKPIALGRLRANDNPGDVDNAPDIIGGIATHKGSKFQLAGWLRDQDIDEYYSMRMQPLQRQGKLFKPAV